MGLRYSYQRLTYLIGNSYLKAALQKGWVTLGVIGATELATEAMQSHNKIKQMECSAEQARQTAAMLPEREVKPYLKRNQKTLDYMAKSKTNGFFTTAIHSETTTTMTGQASTLIGKLGYIFGVGK